MCKSEYYKILLEENTHGTLSDMLQHYILDPSPKAKETEAYKQIISKWHLTKLKSFCTEKENVKK